MGDVKLSDQLGAMAIIDSLYAQHIALDEHFNLPQLRQRIVLRIRDYYKSIGSDINDELIEQGVEVWFNNRLRHKAGKFNLFQRIIARLYISSKVWLSWLLFLGLLWGSIEAVSYYRLTSQLRDIETKITEQITINQQVDTDWKETTQRFERAKLQSKSLQYAVVPGQKILEQMDAYLNEELSSARQPVSTSQSLSAVDSAKQQLADEVKITELYQLRIKQVAALTSKLSVLVKLDSRLVEVDKDPGIDEYVRQSPKLRSTISAAAFALSTNADSTESLVDESVQQLDQERTRRRLLIAFDKKAQQFAALPLLAEDRTEVNILLNHTQSLISDEKMVGKNLLVSTELAMRKVDDLYDFARQPLTVQIVDSAGQKSGVERSYDESGGKSWYLIVEAVTPLQEAFRVSITNSETGANMSVLRFGVRVSQKQYNLVKQDKMDDGHITDPVIGNKPANRLHFKYRIQVLPGYITDW